MTGLRATARLQFHKDFTIDQASELVPYFESLGISHLYASPLLKSRPGSTHGYDIVDHHAIDPELGGILALQRLVGSAARPRHGPDPRHRAEPHGRGRRRQRVVARRAGMGPRQPVRGLFRHRLGSAGRDTARPPARAVSRRVLRRGAGSGRSRPAIRPRGWASLRLRLRRAPLSDRPAPIRHGAAGAGERLRRRDRQVQGGRRTAPECASAPPRPAGAASGGRGASGSDRGRAPRLCREDAGRPGPAAPAAGTPELPARLVAGGGGRDQLAAVLRHQRPCRHPRRGSRRCSTTRTTTFCAFTPRA